MQDFIGERQVNLTEMIDLPLSALVLKYADTLEKMEAFGDESLEITHEWPTKDELKEKELDKKIKLDQVQYKIFGNSDNSLTGIGLNFTTIGTSSFMETEQGKSDTINNAAVDISKKIVKISVRVKEEGKKITGLRLIDDADANVVDINTKDEGDWATKDIPAGKEIIGLYCSTQKGDLEDSIHRLGFILWNTPPS